MTTSALQPQPRKGDFIITRCGVHFWPFDPSPTEVRLADIAHALSQVIRWGGHSPVPLSVAQHCVNVSERAEHLAVQQYGADGEIVGAIAFAGLLHDAAEAYIADLASPIKRQMPQYREVETGIERAIGQHFGAVLNPMHPLVRRADGDMLKTEASVYFPDEAWWRSSDTYLGDVLPGYEQRLLNPLPPARARHSFLKRFGALTGAISGVA